MTAFANFAHMKRMKQLYITIIALAFVLPSTAQMRIHEGPLHSFDAPRKGWVLPGDTVFTDTAQYVYQGQPQQIAFTGNTSDAVPTPPLYTSRFNDYGWGLHEGLNVSAGLSAFATFGKQVPHRGGFSQNLSATYLATLSKNRKLWVAAGGTLRNTNWGSDNYRDALLYAALGYRFNDHWEAWVYGQKSIANSGTGVFASPYGVYPGLGYGFYPGLYSSFYGGGLGFPGADMVGAAVKYSVNPHFSFQLNVETAWYRRPAFQYFDQYNYPAPRN